MVETSSTVLLTGDWCMSGFAGVGVVLEDVMRHTISEKEFVL